MLLGDGIPTPETAAERLERQQRHACPSIQFYTEAALLLLTVPSDAQHALANSVNWFASTTSGRACCKAEVPPPVLWVYRYSAGDTTRDTYLRRCVHSSGDAYVDGRQAQHSQDASKHEPDGDHPLDQVQRHVGRRVAKLICLSGTASAGAWLE